jgi:hypothetical protein
MTNGAGGQELDFDPLLFQGMRVIESTYLTQSGEPCEVRRSWRERLFSWPWRPLQATRWFVPQIPYRGAIQLNANTLVMHPQTLCEMRKLNSMPTNGAGWTPERTRVDGVSVANTFPAVRVLARMGSDGHYGTCDILQLIDVANGMIILEVGTENSDDYYPSFVANELHA